jgi:hypothetical protein
VEQVENRVSATKDKVEKLDQIVKDCKKCRENMNETFNKSGTLSKDQIYKPWV